MITRYSFIGVIIIEHMWMSDAKFLIIYINNVHYNAEIIFEILIIIVSIYNSWLDLYPSCIHIFTNKNPWGEGELCTHSTFIFLNFSISMCF